MHTSRSLPLRVFLTSLLCASLLASFVAPAFADTLAVKQAEASRVAKQVDQLGTNVEIAAEKYNRAKIRYDEITVEVKAQQKVINKLQKKQNFLQGHLNTRVEDMYRNGPLDFVTVLLGVRNFDDFDATFRILTTLNNQDAATVSQLKATKAEAKQAQTLLVAKQNTAHQQKLAMAANQSYVEEQLSVRKRLLAGLDAEVQRLLQQQLASADIPTQARTMASLLRTRSVSQGGVTFGGQNAPNATAAGAVWWAEKQLGKPYVWAAAGPDTFDCSGLCMYAYAHVGVNLNHYSGDQINEGKHVDKSDLLPGDLVFFGSPIHHVGMYVGGGDFIEAPHTGSNVRIAVLANRGDFAGACRPSE